MSTLSPLDREACLLVACARVPLKDADTVRFRRLANEELDWSRLRGLAVRHGLVPLLWWHLNEQCPHAIPPDQREFLRAYSLGTARRNLFLTAELLRLLKAFEGHGLVAVPYKGPALTASLYGNLSLRESSDLDILLAREDLPRAARLAVELGYCQESLFEAAKFSRDIDCEWNFDRENGPHVELHWRIVPNRLADGFTVDPWLARLSSSDLVGTRIAALRPEPLLLALCAHGLKHLWSRLAWICDLSQLVRHFPELDWELLSREAGQRGARRIVHLGLFLAQEILGCELPPAVARDLRGPEVQDLAAPILAGLFAEQAWSPGTVTRCHYFARARERPRDRLACLLRIAMTINEYAWAAANLPGPLAVLYYPLRLLRLIKRYGFDQLAHPTV